MWADEVVEKKLAARHQSAQGPKAAVEPDRQKWGGRQKRSNAKRIKGYIESGVQEGADLVVGRQKLRGLRLRQGFLSAERFSNVTPECDL